LPARAFLRLNKTFTFCVITSRAVRFWFVSPSPLQRDAQLSIARGFRLSTRSDSHVLLPLRGEGNDFHNYMYCCMLVSNFYVKRLSPPPLPPPVKGADFLRKSEKKSFFKYLTLKTILSIIFTIIFVITLKYSSISIEKKIGGFIFSEVHSQYHTSTEFFDRVRNFRACVLSRRINYF